MPSHLEEYLAYYKTCNAPGYAVLVTGDWGVGKTFQVKKALKDSERYYISLFGLQTADEVFSAVFAAMFPKRARVRKAARAVEQTSIGVGGVGIGIGGLFSGIANALIRQKVNIDRTLIFDDLERSGLELRDTLGVINRYVEHNGCRVIVISHDEKLAVDFREAKEKLFGQTVRVEPQTEAAFDTFASSFPSKDAQFVKNHRANIIGIFHASEAKSLRILRHIIEDIVRLRRELSGAHLQHKEAMSELVSMFAALDIEVRGGHLGKKDLEGRDRARLAYEVRRLAAKGEATEKPAFVVADEKYVSVNLDSTLLSDDALVRMLINGSFDRDVIRASIDNSIYFFKAVESPAWQVFMQFDRLEDDVAEAAMKKMNQQFDSREITNSGEILHVFALRLMMSQHGLLKQDYSVVVTECEAYVDDLLAQGRLPPRENNWRWTESFSVAYGGFGYWVDDSYKKEFTDLFRHLIESREKALRLDFPKRTPELLRLVETDGPAFLEKVCHTHTGNNPYADVPVLASIPPPDFVAAWMKSHPRNWYQIQKALTERYTAGRLLDELKEEASWVKEVIELVEAEAESTKGIRKVRLVRSIPRNVKSKLDEVRT